MKQNFEQIIRETVINHKTSYENGAWEKFQSNLPTSTPFYKSNWFLATGITLVFIAGSIGIYFWNTGSEIEAGKQSISQNINTQHENEIVTDVSTIELEEKNREEKNEKEDKNILPEISDKSEIKNTLMPEKKVKNDDDPKKRNQDLNVIAVTNTLTNTVTINETELIAADFNIQTLICMGNTLNLVAENSNKKYFYTWNINNEILLKASLSFCANRTVMLIIKIVVNIFFIV